MATAPTLNPNLDSTTNGYNQEPTFDTSIALQFIDISNASQ